MTYNLAVMKTALELIELHPEKHQQDTWRCGTGQCFAGWIATVAEANWVVPTDELLRAEQKKDKLEQEFERLYHEMRAEGGSMDWEELDRRNDAFLAEHPEFELSDEEQETLNKSDYVFTEDGSQLHVSDYAEKVMGGSQYVKAVRDNYSRNIFGSDNTREDLRDFVAGLEDGTIVEAAWDSKGTTND